VTRKPHLFSTSPIIRHSFATPLTNIVASAEIAAENLRRAQPSSVSEMYVQRVLLNAQHLQAALKLADTENETFSPKNALTELLSLNEGTQLHRHLVSRIFLPEACFLAGNRLAFQEAAACLLNNAYESYRPQQKQRYVFFSALANTTVLSVSVIDGGAGMGWFSQKLSVFPFYSTKQRHSGLGLHFVKQTVEREFNGQFILRSRRGRGTSITLRFPVKRQQTVSKTSAGLQY
jgi:signal transduction histidine kinase